MKLLKGLLLGSTASLAVAALPPAARAADLPGVAPIEYVRICDAYGAGFLLIPGTDTCLRVGGPGPGGRARLRSAVQHFRHQLLTAMAARPTHSGLTPANSKRLGLHPSVSQYTNARSRDATSFNALAASNSIQDAITLWHRAAFLRVDSYYGSGGNSATGALQGTGFANTFRQYGGNELAALFDDPQQGVHPIRRPHRGLCAIDVRFLCRRLQLTIICGAPTQPPPWSPIRRPCPTAFRRPSRPRSGVAARQYRQHNRGRYKCRRHRTSVINIGGVQAASFQPIRQVRGSGHRRQISASTNPGARRNCRRPPIKTTLAFSVRARSPRRDNVYDSAILARLCLPAATSNSYGFAVQGGLQLNADVISPGDKLWLQAAYDMGAFGYIAGNNLGFNYGAVNQNAMRSGTSRRRITQRRLECAARFGLRFTSSTPNSFYRHRLLPAAMGLGHHRRLQALLDPGPWASAVYGSYLEEHFPGDALAGLGGASASRTSRKAGSAPISSGRRSQGLLDIAPNSRMCI